MYINQKAQEISLALIKISVYVRRPEFRQRLEKLAFSLVEEVGRGDSKPIIKTSMALEALINLGRAIYEIEPVNADILIQELNNLNSAVKQTNEPSLPNSDQRIDIKSLFSKTPKFLKESKIDADYRIESGQPEKASDPIMVGPRSNNEDLQKEVKIKKTKSTAIVKTNGTGYENQAIRQSAIVDKIRQFGNEVVKLKDITTEFPKFSERTLRYDLQRLCNQGILERVGTGGPGTHYKLRVI